MGAGGRSSIDYADAEQRYVTQGKSIRAIASEMGLKSWSSMANIAKRDDWAGKREAYKAAIARRSYEASAATVASEGTAIRDEAVLAARVSIRAYLKDLAEGTVKVNAKDAHLWATFLLSEMTEPTGISNEAPDHARNVTPPDAELLRRVVEAARERVPAAGGVGPTALVLSQDTRPN